MRKHSGYDKNKSTAKASVSIISTTVIRFPTSEERDSQNQAHYTIDVIILIVPMKAYKI